MLYAYYAIFPPRAPFQKKVGTEPPLLMPVADPAIGGGQWPPLL